MISAENMNYSNQLDARDRLKQVFGDVRLMGRMGSHTTFPTNLGGGGRLAGAPAQRSRSRADGPVSAGVLRVFGRSHRPCALAQTALGGGAGALGVRKIVAGILARIRWRTWAGATRRFATQFAPEVEIGRTTVATILAAEGIEPAPEREKKRTWKRFMTSHWDTLCACDFFSVEALGITGTVRIGERTLGLGSGRDRGPRRNRDARATARAMKFFCSVAMNRFGAPASELAMASAWRFACV